ncbi:MAG TPA: FAD-binding protein, partial [Coriobacteriia bacterium]|nr:FAD-binding protein [Coriobacteriia bacterium]
PRVLHSGDKTGAAIQQALTDELRASERVAIFEHRFLVDLVTEAGRCIGAVVLHIDSGKAELFRARAVVLATGGAGQVFRVTTNPLIATGDGVAAAWRAGADVTDLEFVQFHPTALDHEAAPRFLVSEALRGEGAYLLDCDHQRFMVGVHPLAELAPRDVVSREIERVMARCGRGNVWLDARHLGADYLRGRFPTIWEACADAGYNLGSDLIPVAPAAHYMIGGVHVDIDGRTSLPGLFASGEVAATGLHGANRLASNSLLEGLVFSRRIVRALRAEAPAASEHGSKIATSAEAPHVDAPAAPDHVAEAVDSLRRTASAYLGMSRTAAGLDSAGHEIGALADEISPSPRISDLEAVNLLTVATLIHVGARARQESRGCHSRLDYPQRDDERWREHIVWNRLAGVRTEPVVGGEK